MSFLVELARSAYPRTALAAFTAVPRFNLDNARAMMWLSQLAYETADRSKVQSILESWELRLLAFVSNDPATGFPPHSACAVVAAGHGATFVTFSGTDPLKFEDWITDFDAVPSPDGLHSGFDDAVATVWPTIEAAIKTRPAAEQALFFTGHSLGGALAILAAARAAAAHLQPTAVYTFGSPRTGGATFFSDYTTLLGDSTFRLVHGTDLVACVPPSLPIGFRHVGCALQCPTDGVFDAQAALMSRDENRPDLVDGLIEAGLADFRALRMFRLIRSIGPRPLDRLAALLPRMVRDHLPATYFRALSIPLGG